MFATLALAAVLPVVPAQPAAFTMKNPRPTYGLMGQTRKDSKFLARDLVIVTYELQNLKVPEADSIVKYSLAIEVTSKDGKSVFKLEPQEFSAELTLGGTSRPATSFYEIPADMKPGDYTFTVTGKDLLANATAKVDFAFEVVPTRLGFIQTGLNIPAGGQLTPSAPNIALGQTVVVGLAVVGFELDPKKKQPNVAIVTEVIDEATGKPTIKPKRGGVMEVKEEEFKKVIPFTVQLELNRPGRFKIQVKVTDLVTTKSAEQVLEITVFENK